MSTDPGVRFAQHQAFMSQGGLVRKPALRNRRHTVRVDGLQAPRALVRTGRYQPVVAEKLAERPGRGVRRGPQAQPSTLRSQREPPCRIAATVRFMAWRTTWL
ncbi:hypothetical protein GCM10007935_30120 [Hydrogenophaga electricum]|uniref:Uncharacterized protein n=1 Tax=Hydrogenophaga electricum TaxID=1230953 RepID=A0ABQ6CBD7_9BURK|nr:hypothetical protein GCM10007935_30120 [Hydrogenophaga electricum]